MTIFIEGPALPLDIKNVNGWGVKVPDADAAISSLKSSVIRVCSRDSPHGCDISEDPKHEIGHIVDAWQQNGVVMTKAAITDSIAQQKIQDGTWGNKWSVFAPSYASLEDGWAKGINIKSLTLVQKPAWADAHYNLSASADGKYELRNISEFTITASQNKEGETITKELEDKIKELETKLEASTKLVEELNPKADSVGILETQVAELTASKATIETELGEKTVLIASLEKEKAGSIPMEKLDEKIAAGIAEHEAKRVLSAARAKFVAARKTAHNIDTKNEEFTSLSAAEFESLATEQGVKLEAGGPGSGPNPVHSISGSGTRNKIPVFDPMTKSFSPYQEAN